MENLGSIRIVAPMIETNKSLFLDAAHMAATGRKKWTHLLATEILQRNLCGLGDQDKHEKKRDTKGAG